MGKNLQQAMLRRRLDVWGDGDAERVVAWAPRGYFSKPGRIRYSMGTVHIAISASGIFLENGAPIFSRALLNLVLVTASLQITAVRHRDSTTAHRLA